MPELDALHRSTAPSPPNTRHLRGGATRLGVPRRREVLRSRRIVAPGDDGEMPGWATIAMVLGCCAGVVEHSVHLHPGGPVYAPGAARLPASTTRGGATRWLPWRSGVPGLLLSHGAVTPRGALAIDRAGVRVKDCSGPVSRLGLRPSLLG